MFDKFDAFEVHPCLTITELDDFGRPIHETCEPEEAQFWSVYGHTPGAGLECLCDCPTEAIANKIMTALEYALEGGIFDGKDLTS